MGGRRPVLATVVTGLATWPCANSRRLRISDLTFYIGERGCLCVGLSCEGPPETYAKGQHPMSTVAPLSQPSGPALADVCKRIREISTLPQVAMRVMEVAGNPDAGAREMKEVMENDVALSARVLRSVNSSAYAVRTRITNLQQAISYLGFKQIRNLAMTASVSRMFQNRKKIGTYSRENLWRHLVAVGICARLLAMRLRLSDFEDIFLAGLLHDCGIVLMDQHAHPSFVAAINALTEGETFPQTERRVFGFDHAMLGGSVAQAWKLPNSIADSIRHHHDASHYRGNYPQMVQCVEVANFLCSLKELTSVGKQLVEFPQATIAAMGLKKEDLVALAQDLDRELEKNQMLSQL